MSLITITTQPSSHSFLAAYSPILFQSYGDNTVVACYADVYFGGNYYKTLYNDTPLIDTGAGTNTFNFDIQNACQEDLSAYTPFLLDNITNTTTDHTMVEVWVQFRGATLDTNNFLQPETPIPVQATAYTPASSGGGVQSNTFYVINTALQFTENQTLETHLTLWRDIHASGFALHPDARVRVYPLTHQIAQDVYADDYAVFPFIVYYNGFAGATDTLPAANYKVVIRLWDAGGFYTDVAIPGTTFGDLTHVNSYLLGTGIANINAILIAASMSPINWDNYGYYHVSIQDISYTNGYLLWTPRYYIRKQHLTKTRLWLQNHFGHYDQISFTERQETFTHSSTLKETPFNPFAVNPFGNGYFSTMQQARYNVRSSEANTVVVVLNEQQLMLAKELAAAPIAYIEWKKSDTVLALPASHPDGRTVYATAGQNYVKEDPANNLRAIRIIDAQITTITYHHRYQYEVTIQYTFTQEGVGVRG